MGTVPTSGKTAMGAVGGMMDIARMLPDEVPTHWLVYFDGRRRRRGGGEGEGGRRRGPFGPVDIDAGRFAVVSEPAERRLRRDPPTDAPRAVLRRPG